MYTEFNLSGLSFEKKTKNICAHNLKGVKVGFIFQRLRRYADETRNIFSPAVQMAIFLCMSGVSALKRPCMD